MKIKSVITLKRSIDRDALDDILVGIEHRGEGPVVVHRPALQDVNNVFEFVYHFSEK